MTAQPGGKVETSIKLQTGNTYTVTVYSFYTSVLPKTDGKCVFYLMQRDINRKILRDLSKSYPVSLNRHEVKFFIKDLELKFVHVYSSTRGYSFEYFPNTEFRLPARISRIEKHLPQVASMLELKQWNHSSINITFVAEFNTTADQELMTFTLRVAEFSEVRLFLNGVLMTYTGLVKCNLNYVDSGSRRSYDRLQSTRSFPVEVESCCNQAFQFTKTVKK